MKKRRLNRKTVTAVFFISAVLLVFTSIGAARAAFVTETAYDSIIEMHDIGVTLKENGNPVAWRSYDTKNRAWNTNDDTASLLSDVDEVKYGTSYDEELTVSNSGMIDEYVRVTVYKYWVDADGKKVTDLDPSMIDLELLTEGTNWIIDSSYTTKERTILYYTVPLKGNESVAGGETSKAFAETVELDGKIKNYASQVITKDEETGNLIYTTEYDYNGFAFCIDVQVDAIQTHNAEDAALSAWGRKISVGSDGSLSLVEG